MVFECLDVEIGVDGVEAYGEFGVDFYVAVLVVLGEGSGCELVFDEIGGVVENYAVYCVAHGKRD